MTMDRLILCTVLGWVGDIIGFSDNYFKAKKVLCTCIFSTSAMGMTDNDGEFPPWQHQTV
jgi:hypothetical protein